MKRATSRITLVLITSSAFLAACDNNSEPQVTGQPAGPLPPVEPDNREPATQSGTAPSSYSGGSPGSSGSHQPGFRYPTPLVVPRRSSSPGIFSPSPTHTPSPSFTPSHVWRSPSPAPSHVSPSPSHTTRGGFGSSSSSHSSGGSS